MYNEDEDPFRDKGYNDYNYSYKNNMFDNDFFEYSNIRFTHAFSQYDPSDPLNPTVNNGFGGDHFPLGKEDNNLNIDIYNSFPFNQGNEPAKKCLTEVNKEDLSAGPVIKPKYKEGTFLKFQRISAKKFWLDVKNFII